MTTDRYHELMNGESQLTPEEIVEGYHFCREFDGLVVGPNDSEMEFCQCEGVPNREANAARAKTANDKAWAEMPSRI